MKSICFLVAQYCACPRHGGVDGHRDELRLQVGQCAAFQVEGAHGLDVITQGIGVSNDLRPARHTGYRREQTAHKDEDYEEDSQYFVGGDFLNIKFEKGDPEAVPGAQIGISVDLTFSTTEDTVEIPVDNNPGEPEEPEEPTDPEAKAPSITIPQDVYTLPGDAEKNADAVISAEAGLKSVKVQIVADNEMFTSIVSKMFGAEPFELIGNETLGPVFSGMGINLPSEGDTEYNFPVGNFFSLLSEMGATESEGHVFNITVEDKNSKTATSKLNVKVEQ